jgi:hypothetical protein
MSIISNIDSESVLVAFCGSRAIDWVAVGPRFVSKRAHYELTTKACFIGGFSSKEQSKYYAITDASSLFVWDARSDNLRGDRLPENRIKLEESSEILGIAHHSDLLAVYTKKGNATIYSAK